MNLTIMQVVLVGAGGFLGAVSRYLVGQWAGRHSSVRLPMGTFLVNLSGSFLLGLLLGSHSNHEWILFAGTGFMGAYTTFSTFKVECLRLIKGKNDRRYGIVYMAFSYVGGIGLAYVGFGLGKLFA